MDGHGIVVSALSGAPSLSASKTAFVISSMNSGIPSVRLLISSESREINRYLRASDIGKSRLTATLMERLADEPHPRLRYFCSPQHTDSALYPFISQMERVAGFTHDDTPQRKLDKLEAMLAQTSASNQDATLLSAKLQEF